MSQRQVDPDRCCSECIGDIKWQLPAACFVQEAMCPSCSCSQIEQASQSGTPNKKSKTEGKVGLRTQTQGLFNHLWSFKMLHE